MMTTMSATTTTLIEPIADRPIEPSVPFEVVDGKVVEKAPMGAYESWLTRALFKILDAAVEERGLGLVVFEMMFSLRPAVARDRRPDLAFVSAERWPIGKAVPHEAAWSVVPDLAIEVVSPSNSMTEVMTKVNEYFAAGVRRVWVIYPDQCIVYDYASPTSISVRTAADDLEGGDLVPGFRLGLAGFFGVEAS
jgi:Uma2 family endonuclease